MKTVFKLAAGFVSAAVLLSLSAGAQAQAYPDVSWNINIGTPGVYAPAPVYRQPPVVVAPAPVIYPAPVVMAPRPVYMAPRPVVVAPAPVYYGAYGAPGWRYRHEQWRHWDHDRGHGRDHGRR